MPDPSRLIVAGQAAYIGKYKKTSFQMELVFFLTVALQLQPNLSIE